MRRIVKETLADGTVHYQVENNKRFFGLFTVDWYPEVMTVDMGYGEFSCLACFQTLKEAQEYCGIDTNPIIKREVV